jgi:hypothetical protein
MTQLDHMELIIRKASYGRTFISISQTIEGRKAQV